jgi:lipoprotein-releasing system permease protein
MFRPLSLFIGLRYARARNHKFFVSFITWVALAGIALGVAALIVVLSVMNGFGGELRNRLLSLTAHARVEWSAAALAGMPADEAASRSAELATRLRAIPGVAGVAPVLELTALGVHQPDMVPLQLRGIDPGVEAQVTSIEALLKQGSLGDLVPGSNHVILGIALAQQLGVQSGERVMLLVPVAQPGAPPSPRLREFTVVGVIEAGLSDHDSTLALAHLDDVAALLPPTARYSTLRLRFNDALAAPTLMPAVRSAVRATTGQSAGADVLVRDWTEDHASYFRALRVEKTMMAVLLLLIVGVAAFNIVAMLVMVVNEKRTDIAILRTLGASPGTILRAFIAQGLVIGWLGVGVGVALGVLVARNVARIMPVLERALGFRFLDPDTYYITTVPSILERSDVIWIASLALAMTLAATIYPALRAAATAPAEALRYE